MRGTITIEGFVDTENIYAYLAKPYVDCFIADDARIDSLIEEIQISAGAGCDFSEYPSGTDFDKKVKAITYRAKKSYLNNKNSRYLWFRVDACYPLDGDDEALGAYDIIGYEGAPQLKPENYNLDTLMCGSN